MSKLKFQLWLWIVAAAAFWGGGCGGVSASRSVSPLDFIMPGLIQNTSPQPPAPDGAIPANTFIASVQPS